MPPHIPHWIDGARRDGASGRTGEVTDSATGEGTRQGRPPRRWTQSPTRGPRPAAPRGHPPSATAPTTPRHESVPPRPHNSPSGATAPAVTAPAAAPER